MRRASETLSGDVTVESESGKARSLFGFAGKNEAKTASRPVPAAVPGRLAPIPIKASRMGYVTVPPVRFDNWRSTPSPPPPKKQPPPPRSFSDSGLSSPQTPPHTKSPKDTSSGSFRTGSGSFKTVSGHLPPTNSSGRVPKSISLSDAVRLSLDGAQGSPGIHSSGSLASLDAVHHTGPRKAASVDGRNVGTEVGQRRSGAVGGAEEELESSSGSQTFSGPLSASNSGPLDPHKWRWKRMGRKKPPQGATPVSHPSPAIQDEMVTQLEDRLLKAKALAVSSPKPSDPPPPPISASQNSVDGGGGRTRGLPSLIVPPSNSSGATGGGWSDEGSQGRNSGRSMGGEEGREETPGGASGEHKSLLRELEEMRVKAERAEQARVTAEQTVIKRLAEADRSLKEVEEQTRVREVESAHKIAVATLEASRALAEAEDVRRVARKEAKNSEEALASAARTSAALEGEARKRQEAEQADFRRGQTNMILGNYTQYTYEELQAATDNFSASKKIGEGGFGIVYGGTLHHTAVAIKVLKKRNRAWSEVKQELEVMGEIHHPHMVMLLGCCPSHFALVYELMASGSLEDWLTASDDPTKALPWYARVRICAEVASALLVLHTRPAPIVHRDLKPANILLDKNLVAKLGDVGLAKFMMTTHANQTCVKDSRPVGTFAYVDPEFQQTGEFGPKSDVYALGIVLLDMLTGRKPHHYKGIEEAIESGNVDGIWPLLDASAGDWPKDVAVQLATLAVSCSEMRRKKRPDLGRSVMPQLDRMRTYAVAVEEEERRTRDEPKVWTTLCCPITQELMHHPVLAADGHTYERAAICQWFLSSDRSPMTNELLPHTELVPNHAIKAMIEDHQPQSGRE